MKIFSLGCSLSQWDQLSFVDYILIQENPGQRKFLFENILHSDSKDF